MRTTKLLSHSLIAAVALPAVGCFIVDDAALDELEVVDTPDSGALGTADTCGAPGYTVTMNGIYDVSTVGASNDTTNSTCGASRAAPGPDTFLGLEASEGQYWHFHVSPASGETADVNPVISLFRTNSSGVCNTAECTFVSNRCATKEEHFGVRIPSNPGGGWQIAIDNALDTSAHFNVAVFQPICNNGTLEHGESCDPSVSSDPPCGNDCRRTLSTTGPAGEPNDDTFWADRVAITKGGPAIRIDDFVDGQCDPDVLVVSVPAASNLAVRAMTAGGVSCQQFAAATTDFQLHFTSATGTNLGSFTADGGGCGIATIPGGASGTEVFITVEGATGTTGLKPYRLEFSIP